MSKEKLTEATILALQGKLTEGIEQLDETSQAIAKGLIDVISTAKNLEEGPTVMNFTGGEKVQFSLRFKISYYKFSIECYGTRNCALFAEGQTELSGYLWEDLIKINDAISALNKQYGNNDY